MSNYRMDILEIDFFRVYNNIDNLKKNITIFLKKNNIKQINYIGIRTDHLETLIRSKEPLDYSVIYMQDGKENINDQSAYLITHDLDNEGTIFFKEFDPTKYGYYINKLHKIGYCRYCRLYNINTIELYKIEDNIVMIFNIDTESL